MYCISRLYEKVRVFVKIICPVENTIRIPSSNGTVEGHVTQVKSIKMQMYGRAGFKLLRRKVILSQSK